MSVTGSLGVPVSGASRVSADAVSSEQPRGVGLPGVSQASG